MRAALAAWRQEVGAAGNRPNPEFDPAAFRALYREVDAGRFDPAQAGDPARIGAGAPAKRLGVPIEVVIQEKQLGTAHALQCAESKIKGDFLVLPGDNYIDPQSIARIRDTPNAILVKEHPNPSNFGVVLLNNGRVTEIVEKPEHSSNQCVPA